MTFSVTFLSNERWVTQKPNYSLLPPFLPWHKAPLRADELLWVKCLQLHRESLNTCHCSDWTTTLNHTLKTDFKALTNPLLRWLPFFQLILLLDISLKTFGHITDNLKEYTIASPHLYFSLQPSITEGLHNYTKPRSYLRQSVHSVYTIKCIMLYYH